ncbi:C2 family cysteine protease [Myxococcota bacterium]|nr:C2 family cysteine protease [Myxococcota bacterium]
MTRTDRLVRLDAPAPRARAPLSGTDLDAGVVPETLAGVRAFRAVLRGASPPASAPVSPASSLRDHHVVQDRWGDCWFLAALSAVTRLRPDLVEDLARPSGDGHWTVWLWTLAGDRAPIDVRAEPGDGWAKVIERALGEHYDVTRGAPLDQGFFALTGRKGNYVFEPAHPTTSVAAWNAIVRASQAGSAMTTGTVPHAQDVFEQLHGSHAYDVVGPDLARGEPHVILRDPHGTRLWIPFESYFELAEDLCVLKLGPRDAVPRPPSIDDAATRTAPAPPVVVATRPELEAIVRDRLATRIQRA